MKNRQRLIEQAKAGDFGAVDALIDEGESAMEDVLQAIDAAEVSTSATLGFAAACIAGPGTVEIAARFLTTEVSLEAFVAATEVLSRVGDPLGHLQRYVENADEPETRRGIAARGLGHTGDRARVDTLRSVAASAEESGDHVLLADCIEALIALGDHSLDEKAAKLLRSRKVEPKLRAAAVLPYLFYPELPDTLRGAMKQANAEIRRAAVDASYYLGTRGAAEDLLKAARDRDARTKENAIARLASITGADLDEDTVEEAAGLITRLAPDVCHRDGEPFDLVKLADRAAQANLRSAIVEEVRVTTGHSFDYNPNRPDGDAAVVNRIRRWLSTNGSRFENGACYKFGFRQDLTTLQTAG